MSELLSTKEAAKIAGVTDARIRQLLIEGKLKGQKVGGYQWVIKRAELDKWLAERERA